MSRSIASLALLKVTWDNADDRRDYIQNFVPFVATLFNQKGYRRVKINALRKDFEEFYGLSIPYHPMIVILDRARKCGYITKQSNGYFAPVQQKVQEADFSDIAHDLERQYENTIRRFVEFCAAEYQEVISEEEAEQVLIAFLKDHDLDLLFLRENSRSLLPVAEATVSQKYLMYRFVLHTYESEPTIFQFILDYSIGHIFANTLTFDEGTVDPLADDLAGCNIYLDIAFLFNVTGINGEERKDAFREFLEALRQQKANLYVFRHTYDEFRVIIDGSLRWVDSMNYDPTRASRATDFFLENGFGSSDIEQFILGLDPLLRQQGIVVVESPDPQRDKFHQIDEKTLTDLIVDIYKSRDPSFDENDKEYTIYRDVKSIAAIYKLRQGARPTTIRDVSNVFITTNSAIALASKRFETLENADHYFYIPTAITDVFLGTIIWLRSPKIVSSFNEKRLISACVASLRPSRAMMKKLTTAAEHLYERGDISPEDFIILNQSRVARNLLQDETLGDPNRFTDKTPLDILEELKNKFHREATEAYTADRVQFESTTREIQAALETQLSEIRDRDNRIEQRDRQIMDYDAKIERTASFVAKSLTGLFYAVSVVFVIVTTVVTFFPSLTHSSTWLHWILIGIAILIAVANIVIGFNIKDTGTRFQRSMQKRITEFLKP